MAGVSVNVYVPSAFTLTGGSLTLPSLTLSTYTLRCTVSVAPGEGGLPPAVSTPVSSMAVPTTPDCGPSMVRVDLCLTVTVTEALLRR